MLSVQSPFGDKPTTLEVEFGFQLIIRAIPDEPLEIHEWHCHIYGECIEEKA